MNDTQPEPLLGMEVRPELILLNIDANDSMQAVEKLADKLLREGMVKPGYIPAILKREEEFCTGLTFDEMSIAIPHTDAEHVNIPCIGIATMLHPVAFGSMGMPEVTCEVEMLFMLAITDPKSQLDFLKTIMKVFQTPGRLRDLKACSTAEALAELFKSYF